MFVIACSNVANLILARSVRREGELAVRAALGAGHGALRRTLLAESLVLCGAGAVLGVLLARPLVAMVARYAARFSVRALDVTVDASVLWVGAGLAMAAAVLLAYVPRLPSPHAPAGLGLASGSVRITPGTNRRLRVFATTQIAFSFVLLAGAGMLLATLVALQTANTGYDMRQVLAFDIPTSATGHRRREGDRLLSGSDAARSASCPASRASRSGASCRGATPAASVPASSSPSRATRRRTAKRIRARGCASSRLASSPCSASRCSPAATSPTRTARGSEPVVIVSQSVAQRLFPNGDAREPAPVVDRSGYFGKPVPRRIVGVVADVDDENVVPGPALTIYQPVRQMRRRRPPVRARGRRSVRARAGGDARSSARSRRTSRSSAPRRSRTCARRCCRPSG